MNKYREYQTETPSLEYNNSLEIVPHRYSFEIQKLRPIVTFKASLAMYEMFVSIGREEEDSGDSPDQGRLACRKTMKSGKKKAGGRELKFQEGVFFTKKPRNQIQFPLLCIILRLATTHTSTDAVGCDQKFSNNQKKKKKKDFLQTWVSKLP